MNTENQKNSILRIKDFFKNYKKQGTSKGSNQDTKLVNSVPCYILIPNYNFYQLFLIGNANQAYSNRFLAQQTLNKYEIKDAENVSFNMNNFLNKGSIVDNKELHMHILSAHMDIDDENKNQEDEFKDEEDFQVGLQLGKKEDWFYDRKDFIKSFKQYEKDIAYPRKTKFIKLREMEESDIPNKIIEILSKRKSCTTKPILFYKANRVSSSIDFPLKVPIRKKFKFTKEQLIKIAKKHKINVGDEENHLQDIEKFFYDNLLFQANFQLSYIIGSKNGIPVLILFDGNEMYKIYDNKSEKIKNYDDFKESVYHIYNLYYSIDILNISIQLKNESILQSRVCHDRITDTDQLLKGFIKYKLDNSWSNHEFNFIELIRESVIYPAFFAFCSKKTLLTSFNGSVVLGTDRYSENSILNQLEQKEKSEVDEFTQTYGTFTAFVLSLPKFLESVINLPDSEDDEKVLFHVRHLFGSLAAHNVILFDLFVDFLLKICNSQYLKNFGRCQKLFRQYLVMTVSNKEDLGFPKENYQIPTFSSIFNLSQRQGERANTITAAQKLNEILENENYKQFFETKVKTEFENLEDIDQIRIKNEPKYNKVSAFKEFLAKEYLFPEINP